MPISDNFLLSGLLNFALYFSLAVIFLLLFKIIYAKITPHDEWALIKDQTNTAASVAFGGAIIGYAIAIAGVIKNSVSLFDFALWSIVALCSQLIAFAIVRFLFMPKVVERIEKGEVSAGVVVATMSLAIGILNAACMTY